MSAWPDEDDGQLDHHPPCPCGRELADECMCPNWTSNPFGSMRIEEPIGSRLPPEPPTQDR